MQHLNTTLVSKNWVMGSLCSSPSGIHLTESDRYSLQSGNLMRFLQLEDQTSSSSFHCTQGYSIWKRTLLWWYSFTKSTDLRNGPNNKCCQSNYKTMRLAVVVFVLLIELNLLWRFTVAPVALSALSCGSAVYTRGRRLSGSPVRTITEMILHGRLSSVFLDTASSVGSYAASGWHMKWALCLQLLGIHLLHKVRQESQQAPYYPFLLALQTSMVLCMFVSGMTTFQRMGVPLSACWKTLFCFLPCIWP